jgi:hypothetical protein
LHIGNLDLDRERALQLPVVQDREWAAMEMEGAISQRPADGERDGHS